MAKKRVRTAAALHSSIVLHSNVLSTCLKFEWLDWRAWGVAHQGWVLLVLSCLGFEMLHIGLILHLPCRRWRLQDLWSDNLCQTVLMDVMGVRALRCSLAASPAHMLRTRVLLLLPTGQDMSFVSKLRDSCKGQRAPLLTLVLKAANCAETPQGCCSRSSSCSPRRPNMALR
jgi:hypothetical protein